MKNINSVLLNHKDFLKRGEISTSVNKQASRNVEKHRIFNNFHFIKYIWYPSKPEELKIKISDRETFYLVFCVEGVLPILLDTLSTNSLKPYQSAMIYDKDGTGILLKAKPQSFYKFFILAMSANTGETSSIDPVFCAYKENFIKKIPRKNRVCIEKANLKLSEKIIALSRLSKKNLAEEIIMKGIILEIFGQKILELDEGQKMGAKGKLNFFEMKSINAVLKAITENPSKNYNVAALARDYNITQTKLQEGFKLLHNRTVMDHIRHVRLQSAVELMKENEMNISQIVYEIGFTSRSYFSKIFKEKFKCTPSHFMQELEE